MHPLLQLKVFRDDNFTCRYCDWNAKASFLEWRKACLAVDHIVPALKFKKEKREDADARPNLVTACHSCNLKKGARDFSHVPEQYRVAAIREWLEKLQEQCDEPWYEDCVKGGNPPKRREYPPMPGADFRPKKKETGTPRQDSNSEQGASGSEAKRQDAKAVDELKDEVLRRLRAFASEEAQERPATPPTPPPPPEGGQPESLPDALLRLSGEAGLRVGEHEFQQGGRDGRFVLCNTGIAGCRYEFIEDDGHGVKIIFFHGNGDLNRRRLDVVRRHEARIVATFRIADLPPLPTVALEVVNGAKTSLKFRFQEEQWTPDAMVRAMGRLIFATEPYLRDLPLA